MSKKAVVLLSGGLDSGTTLAIAKDQGYELHAISFKYGQNHSFELQCAKNIASYIGVESHKIIEMDIGSIGGSALTDKSLKIPKNRDDIADSGIPVTYVPARNLIFLSYALAYAEVIGAFEIFIGVNALDYSGYPDCRPEFIESFEKTANLATAAAAERKGKFQIKTPIINMTKAQIIAHGTSIGFDYSLTHSCYDPDEKGISCGQCDACKLRINGFRENGLKDPIRYQERTDENS